MAELTALEHLLRQLGLPNKLARQLAADAERRLSERGGADWLFAALHQWKDSHVHLRLYAATQLQEARQLVAKQTLVEPAAWEADSWLLE